MTSPSNSSSLSSFEPGLGFRVMRVENRDIAFAYSSFVLITFTFIAQSSKSFLAVFGMSANPINKYKLLLVSNCNNQAVSVSLYVENHSVVGEKVRGRISFFNVLSCVPFCAFHFFTPRFQRTT